MKFPQSDIHWQEVSLFLSNHGFQDLHTIAAVEFCVILDNCVPYEWSYWHELSDFACIIVHKGMLECFKNNFLDNLADKYDYVFGNYVFKVFILSTLNIKKLAGDHNHFSTSTQLLRQKSYPKRKTSQHSTQEIQNILLVTANNNGNIGDDAITYAAFDMLQSIYPFANIIIDKAPASKQLISQVDLVILGGGGIFYDNCFYNAQNYCQYFLYAHELGVRSCAIGIGALGRRTTLGNELFKHALDLAEFIVVRDRSSQHALQAIIKTKTPVIVKQDVAFTLQPQGITHLKPKSDKAILLFSLIDATGKPNAIKYQTHQTECIQYLMQYFDIRLLVQSTDDLSFYQSLSKKFTLEIITVNYQNVKHIINIYKQCDLVITARLHGFIFASLASVPTITVATNRDGSKLYRIIVDSIPSAKLGFINKNDYALSTLKHKIDLYFKDKSCLIVDRDEVKACQTLASETSSVIREYL